MKAAAVAAAKCWVVATPLGLVLRGISKGYVPPTPFIIVSMVSTGVLLIGWRSALAAATPKKVRSFYACSVNQSFFGQHSFNTLRFARILPKVPMLSWLLVRTSKATRLNSCSCCFL